MCFRLKPKSSFRTFFIRSHDLVLHFMLLFVLFSLSLSLSLNPTSFLRRFKTIFFGPCVSVVCIVAFRRSKLTPSLLTFASLTDNGLFRFNTKRGQPDWMTSTFSFSDQLFVYMCMYMCNDEHSYACKNFSLVFHKTLGARKNSCSLLVTLKVNHFNVIHTDCRSTASLGKSFHIG